MERNARMSGGWIRRTGSLLSALLLLGFATMAPAGAASPGPEFKLQTDSDDIFTSPDGQIRVEQYGADKGDEGFLFQFWTFDSTRQHASLLNPGEGVDRAGYRAGFRFSADSQWLVRSQKTGAGFRICFCTGGTAMTSRPPRRSR